MTDDPGVCDTRPSCFTSLTRCGCGEQKHEALDQTVHSLLGFTMLACCIAVLVGLRAPHNWLANMLRSLTTSMQGVWLIQVRLPDSANPTLPWCPTLVSHLETTFMLVANPHAPAVSNLPEYWNIA